MSTSSLVVLADNFFRTLREMPPVTTADNRKATPTLLFRSLPSTAFIGVDLLAFTTSPNLHGIKNLPPGYHFLYSSSEASLSLRHGRWFSIPTRTVVAGGAGPWSRTDSEILVWRWSTELECLVPETDTTAAGGAHTNLDRAWGRALLDYRQPGRGNGSGNGGQAAAGGSETEWRELTGHITDGLLDRVLGAGHDTVGKEARSRGWSISSVSSAPGDVDKIPGLTFSEGALEGEKDLNFLPIDLKKTWREGAVGRERTDAARDRSWYLRNLIEGAAGSGGDRRVGAAQLLGELELCFLMVLTLANWSCLEQWKRILSVFLSCRQALGEVEDYFVAVLRLLRVQLRHCDDVEGGLFDLREEGAGWLKSLLAQFRRNADDVSEGANGEMLKVELDKLEVDLRDIYGWESGKHMLKRGLLELEDGERVDMDMNGADEEDEMGEFAPTVVDLG